MGKLDTKKQIKLNSLLDSAFELFTENGIGETSISDISKKAGVAKGTFYLYFKDKLDIRDKLIAAKSHKLFSAAIKQLEQNKEKLNLEDSVVFVIEYIINEFEHNHKLLSFISKNLSWGTFEKAVRPLHSDDDIDIAEYFSEIDKGLNTPDIMFFMITELVSGVCYNAILTGQPVSMEEIKPHLFTAVRNMVRQFSGKNE